MILTPHRYLRFAAACLSLASFALGRQSQAFTISGTMVEFGTNRPLNRVLVTIAQAEHPEFHLSQITAGDGRFLFSNLPAGKYSLQAQKHGALPEGFHQNENYATAIAAGPGLNSENLIFPLDVPGSISGTVLDEQGDPVAQAQLWVFRKSISSGKSAVLLQGTYPTDSSGAFYVGPLPPGTYYLAAQGHPWYAQNFVAQEQPEGEGSNPDSQLDVAYPLTYYGDSSDPGSATPVTVSEGGAANLQITLRAVPAVHVTLTGGTPENSPGIAVFAAGPEGILMPTGLQVFNIENRQIAVLAPGRYVVTLQPRGPAAPSGLAVTTMELTGNATLDMSELPKLSLTGQISFENNERPRPVGAIQLNPLQPSFQGSVRLAIANDGSFNAMESPNLLPGRYEILLAAPDFYIKSLAVKGANTFGTQIDIPAAGAIQISITAAKGLTRIDGLAVDQSSNPTPGAMVLLVPQDLSRIDLFRRDQSDSDGTFSLYGVAPGRYTLVAIDNGRDLEYQNPAIIRSYLNGGTSVDVPPRNRSSVTVTVQPRH